MIMGDSELGRGLEPLGKGLKPFAFTELCHASDPFLGLDGGSLFVIKLSSLLREGACVEALAPLFRSFRTRKSPA